VKDQPKKGVKDTGGKCTSTRLANRAMMTTTMLVGSLLQTWEMRLKY